MKRAEARRLAPLVAVAALLALAGCRPPEHCVGRGSSSVFTGVMSYAIAGAAGETTTGTITVYDYAPDCAYPSEEFKTELGSCGLWASLAEGPEPPTRYFPGSPDAWASYDPPQTCALALHEGTGAFQLTSGEIAFSDATTDVLLSGKVEGWVAGAGPTGPIQLELIGAGAP